MTELREWFDLHVAPAVKDREFADYWSNPDWTNDVSEVVAMVTGNGECPRAPLPEAKRLSVRATAEVADGFRLELTGWDIVRSSPDSSLQMVEWVEFDSLTTDPEATGVAQAWAVVEMVAGIWDRLLGDAA